VKPLLLAACLAFTCPATWAQRSDGQPSPAVREQQRQAEQARKQHSKSAPAKQPKASVKVPGDKNAKPPRSKPGEAAVTTRR
jgi:hypothetical protein